MKSQVLPEKGGLLSADKMSTILLKIYSGVIPVYLWFLQFSIYLLRLVQ